MDGFHLSQSALARLGRLSRKGAIDTFDGAGFLALLRRLRDPGEEVIYAPEFRRELEDPVAGVLPVEPWVGLVVVEGNYLLMPDGSWGRLRPLFDQVWYCRPDERVRMANLVDRHRRYGKPEDEARRWAFGPDQHNAGLIAATLPRADVIVTIDGQLPAGPGYSRPTSREAKILAQGADAARCARR